MSTPNLPATSPPVSMIQRHVETLKTVTLDPRITIKFDDEGFAHRTYEMVRLYVGPDLYSAKQPMYEVWGSGVAKYAAASGARMTPLKATPDPVEGRMKPGLRITTDEFGGPLDVEQDVLLEMRHPKTGSPIYIISTGRESVRHLLVGQLAKKLSDRDDVARLVTEADIPALRDDTKATWATYAYMPGVYIAVNMRMQGIREVFATVHEMARLDKVVGKATSKAQRLAMKQANVLPIRFTAAQLRKDKAGAQYIDVPVFAWMVYDSRDKMQQAIDAMLAQNADILEATYFVSGDDSEEGADPEDTVDFEQGDTAPESRQLTEDLPDGMADETPPAREPVPVEAKREPEPAPKAKAAPKATPKPSATRQDPALLARVRELDDIVQSELGDGGVDACRDVAGVGTKALADLTDDDLRRYLTALQEAA